MIKARHSISQTVCSYHRILKTGQSGATWCKNIVRDMTKKRQQKKVDLY